MSRKTMGFFGLATAIALWVSGAYASPLPGGNETSPVTQGTTAVHSQHLRFRITLDQKASTEPVSGRLIVFMAEGTRSADVIRPPLGSDVRKVWITSKEIRDLHLGDAVEVQSDASSFPGPLWSAPVGDYQLMALLDVNHQAAYRAFRPGDFVSQLITVKGFNPGATSALSLSLARKLPEPSIQVPPNTEIVDFVSPSLSAFWGKPVHMKAVVVLPSNYRAHELMERRFPSVYILHGFFTTWQGLVEYYAGTCSKLMANGKLPAMIQVVLDQSCPSGTHEFVDSPNNGPWGTALTTEFIPYLEQHFRMEAHPTSRFLTGHSSGGWAALWLQLTYPTLFGGAWVTSPDPVDFREFLGTNLTDLSANNFYRDREGKLTPLIRIEGKPSETNEDFSKQEAVLGDFGGQMSSFEWVFSPKGSDGNPQRLYDRTTGKLDPAVAKAWAKYDIARVLRERWQQLGPALQGKLHVTVGTEDAVYLDRAVRLLEQTLQGLGSDATFTYQPSQEHVNLFMNDNLERFEREMEATRTSVKKAR